MKRGLFVIATLFSLTACSAQQVQDAALFTVGAALRTAMEIDKANDERDRSNSYCGDPIFEETAPDLFTYGGGGCAAPMNREQRRQLYEAAEANRAAHRRAELNAALEAFNAASPVADPEQRSVVLMSSDPFIPPEAVERFNAAMPENLAEY